MKVLVLLTFLCLYDTQASPTDINLLSSWLKQQQYTNQSIPQSLGAVKVHYSPATNDQKGTGYFRVSPYLSNLGMIGLLQANNTFMDTVKLWIVWYFSHLNQKSAPSGVPFEHFYDVNGNQETICVQPGSSTFCNYNDATDSAAATFLYLLKSAYTFGLPKSVLVQYKGNIEKLGNLLLSLQQRDGLLWAKTDYRVKYLEDNCEVFAGLKSLSYIEQYVFQNVTQAGVYNKAADRIQSAILRELYNNTLKRYRVAKFESGTFYDANPDIWYPDLQAQFWPHLWEVVAYNDVKTQNVLKLMTNRWNDWTKNPTYATGWIESGVAHAIWLTGDKNHTMLYLQAVKRLKFPLFPWPFTVTDAGWLIQTFSQQNMV
ncbi:unnamed protein product [Rotaria sp. Silwood2]|nr:unnamed protein product [Rotaria sp. Silwood2]CAF4330664.1 unnamed protein product [Rotaria sp. Silwood2]